MKKYKKSIFIFTRDLRLYDNTSLLKALKYSDIVIPIFIFNPTQIKKNKYKSNNCIQFMCESLDDLNLQLHKKHSRLFYFYDDPKIILNKLIKLLHIDAIFMNCDYSPFAIKRENIIKKLCLKYNIDFNSYDDYLLTNKNILNKNNLPYVKFTPFYKHIKHLKINKINTNIHKYNNFYNKNLHIKYEYLHNIHKFYKYNNLIHVHGGRKNALLLINKKNIKLFNNYNHNRDFINYNTTHLSPYLKFNVISIREIYFIIKNNLGSHNNLIKQLYWRDFYMIILFKFPFVINHSYHPIYDNITWSNNKSLFNKWCLGETGYPIIDASMKQLNTTGYMHNRCRMLVASFLVKLLHINWKWGEHYFATKLIDYDIANNNGGWQWIAGSGSDSQPYFRIFNPILQTKKYDPNCLFIKKWLPVFNNIDINDIINWNKVSHNYNIHYPTPIINYDIEKHKSIQLYKKIY